MRRRVVAVTAALVSTAIVAGGCAPAETRWVTPAASASPGAAAPEPSPVTWKDCADVAASVIGTLPRTITFECATVEVPQDWSTAVDGKAPDGKTYSIALLRARSSKQKNRIGSLLINPGGPGGSGVEYAVYLANLAGVNTRFDIVGFDPRGVGRSTQIKCLTDSNLDDLFGYDPDPASQASFDAYVALNRKVGEACGEKYGESLRYFSTEQTARDMDAVRAAVGDAKTTFLGYSYGTLLGGVYAELFPTKIRAMVLDGAIDPQEKSIARSEGQAKGFERAFTNFATWCTSTPASCSLGSDPRATVLAAMKAARKSPVVGSGGRTATPGWVMTATISALYVKSYWPTLADAIAKLARNDPSGVFELADNYTERDSSGQYTNLFDANTAVNCADYDDYPTVAEIRDLQAKWRAKYPLFGTLLAVGMVGCATWPAKHDPFPVGPAKGAPPIVVVGTLGDPATPYEQTAKLAAMLGTGTVVTWEGEGHTAYPQTTCISQAVNRYLINLTVPATGLSCPP